MNLTMFVKPGEYTPDQDTVTTVYDKVMAGMKACEISHADVVRLVFPEGETVDLLTEREFHKVRKDTVSKVEFYVHGNAG